MAEAKIDKWDKSKWLNEPYEKNKNLFNFHRAYQNIIGKNYAIIVEGYFDVAGLHNKGIKNSVATCGTNLSKYQAYLIKTICDYCLIMFDGDEAGRNASVIASETLHSINLPCTIITLGDGIDPDDYIKKKNPRRFSQILDDIVRQGIRQVNLT
jgi:DNA primase